MIFIATSFALFSSRRKQGVSRRSFATKPISPSAYRRAPLFMNHYFRAIKFLSAMCAFPRNEYFCKLESCRALARAELVRLCMNLFGPLFNDLATLSTGHCDGMPLPNFLVASVFILHIFITPIRCALLGAKSCLSASRPLAELAVAPLTISQRSASSLRSWPMFLIEESKATFRRAVSFIVPIGLKEVVAPCA